MVTWFQADGHLTEEQQKVIQHPIGMHARILAVAGSGKTTTMGYRIKHLAEDLGVNPEAMRILMFNRLARQQFRNKLEEIGIPLNSRPQIHTFHSFSYQFISTMMARGFLPGSLVFWIEDKEELKRRAIHQAIDDLVRRHAIPPDSVDPAGALECISLWKGSLIPPLEHRAGHRGNPNLPLVYREFEKMRFQNNALTYDDFIPIAVSILENEPKVAEIWTRNVDHVIADEYQDVNYGQQRLIELLAGNRADVTVIGDDDQTIFEWRGARPSYILEQFQHVFANKPHVDYTLSHSFRFGPVIAQCAHNVIAFNKERSPKQLISHFVDQPAAIHVLSDTSEQPMDVDQELARQVVAAVRETRNPQKIIVLGRMYSQLSGLEAAFLAQGIPYRVLGRAPFFERNEIRNLVHYVRLGAQLDEPMTRQTEGMALAIANVPNRRLHRETLAQALQSARLSGHSLRNVLDGLSQDVNSPLSRPRREEVDRWLGHLERLQERLADPSMLAGNLLLQTTSDLGYLKHFDNYFGGGESSEDRKRTVILFCDYATALGLSPLDFVAHVEKLDPTRGVPEEQQIVMTTVFRTKGLEYDYVFVPACTEGYMPCLITQREDVFDKAGIISEPAPSHSIENERRLFYVAITRAKKAVYISTGDRPRLGSQSSSASPVPSRFIHEMQLESTNSIIGSLQRSLSGDAQARTQLLQSLQQKRYPRGMIENLRDGYLQLLPDKALASEIRLLTAQVVDVHFAYPVKYSDHRQTPNSSMEPPEETPFWWQD